MSLAFVFGQYVAWGYLLWESKTCHGKHMLKLQVFYICYLLLLLHHISHFISIVPVLPMTHSLPKWIFTILFINHMRNNLKGTGNTFERGACSVRLLAGYLSDVIVFSGTLQTNFIGVQRKMWLKMKIGRMYFLMFRYCCRRIKIFSKFVHLFLQAWLHNNILVELYVFLFMQSCTLTLACCR